MLKNRSTVVQRKSKKKFYREKGRVWWKKDRDLAGSHSKAGKHRGGRGDENIKLSSHPTFAMGGSIGRGVGKKKERKKNDQGATAKDTGSLNHSLGIFNCQRRAKKNARPGVLVTKIEKTRDLKGGTRRKERKERGVREGIMLSSFPDFVGKPQRSKGRLSRNNRIQR